ncbi:MAG TPA: hypothetical protein VHV32_06425 [Candidatus Angelobacter sp.]|nr:hypothetical protein [Candidatus Angelobacter sp.]
MPAPWKACALGTMKDLLVALNYCRFNEESSPDSLPSASFSLSGLLERREF